MSDRNPSRRRCRRLTSTSCRFAALLAMVLLVPGASASADPVLTPGSAVGANRPAPSVLSLPTNALPAITKLSDRCGYRFVNLPPSGTTILHVAPCGTSTGDGSLDRPWRTIAQAMAEAAAGQTIYVHDDPALAVDYAESDLRPSQGGTGAPCTAAGATPNRIRLTGAPGEGMPTIAKHAGATTAKPVLRLDKPWWLVENLRILGRNVASHSTVSISAGCTVLRKVEVTESGTANAAIAFSSSHDAAVVESHIWEPLTGDEVTGRPAAVPVDSRDHHGITVSGTSNRVLVRGVHSYGHNGDSVQCGESTSASAAEDPQNVTVEGNRFHQDEENAVDIKHCSRVSIHGNKFFGYHPARPLSTWRASQGDALVIHHNSVRAGAAQVLVEQNRFFRNSRSVNVGTQPSQVVIRRNVIFDAKNDHCGMGAGIRASGHRVEIYHNTIDLIPGPQSPPDTGCPTWSASDRAAIQFTDQSTATNERTVLWNNIVSRASLHLSANVDSAALDARSNLFDTAPSGGTPQGSIISDPLYVADPASNDYYTRLGSRALDRATPVSTSLADPMIYCDDPGDADTVKQPDIGFLESCSCYH